MTRKIVSDILFLIQFIGAVVWCVMSWRKIEVSTQGVSMSYLVLFEGYVVLQILLLLGAYREARTRSIRQMLSVSFVWLLLLPPCIITLISRGYNWSLNDNLTVALGVVGSVFVWCWGKMHRLGLRDAQIRAYLAIVLKATPQFLLAYKMAMDGTGGVSGIALITGHTTIVTRFTQMWMDARQVGWDRNRKWFLVAEIGNEVSWAAATIVWCLR